MPFPFFDFVVLLGCANAFVFAGVLWSRPHKTKGDHLLAAVLAVLGLLCAKLLLHTLGGWQTVWFRYFPLGIDLWLPPLLWLYVLALTEPSQLVSAQFYRHLFLPLLFLAYAIVVYAVTLGTNDLNAKDLLAAQCWFKWVKGIEDILSFLLGIYYGFLALGQLKKYRHWVLNFTADNAVPTYGWLRNLLLVTAVVLTLLGLMLLATQLQLPSLLPLRAFYVYLVFLVYVFGYFGFRHPNYKVLLEQVSKKAAQLSNAELGPLLERLDHWMQTAQPFLEPGLNLKQCAAQLACSTQQLSAAINQGKNKHFRDYINDLRIEAFKARAEKANFQRETIMGIAYDCGFNSEASFYRLFKEKTGMTPKQFLRQ